tara:strand:- start:617 stop:1207 length:591 start_codon:yes stop_codon:yes gene_type:complete
MAKPIEPFIKEVLDKYDIDPRRALWDCHGTWIIYHKYVEMLGAKAGVTLEAPQIVTADPAAKMVVICVSGQLGDRHEWSFGEAAPYNNKNAYPFAMAEKRAKDRVILKLVGLAGHVYTDEDVYDIKDGKPQWEAPAVADTPTIGDSNAFRTMLEEAQSLEDLNAFAKEIGASDLPAPSKAALRKVYAKRKKEISNG